LKREELVGSSLRSNSGSKEPVKIDADCFRDAPGTATLPCANTAQPIAARRRSMSTHRLFIGALVLAMTVAYAAQAEKPLSASHQFIKRCEKEAKKLCGGSESGETRIAECLAAHKESLGKPCTASLRRAKRVANFRARCGADVKQHCSGVMPGSGRIHECLKLNESSISATCKARLAKGINATEVTDAATLVDDAVAEEQLGLTPVPIDLPLEEEVPAIAPPDPAATPDIP
jgi:hypothetical protein